jgi:flavorubredoxin
VGARTGRRAVSRAGLGRARTRLARDKDFRARKAVATPYLRRNNRRPPASKIAIVYHSGYGHTAKQAEAVARGVTAGGGEVTLLAVADLVDTAAPGWAALDAADAIIFGAPTYMGSASAPFKAFMDATSSR